MILKVLTLATFLLLEVSLVKGQWYGAYDCGQYSQQYIILNPYGSGYDDIYSQFGTYTYNDPQFYGGYSQTYPQYPAQQPIIVVVNNDRSDCEIDDILSLIFPIEEKRKEPVYVPMPIVIETRDDCEVSCKCECRCECPRSDYCPHCDSPKSRCRCQEDCQCKKKEKKPKCKCNECQKHDTGCGCRGSIYHKIY